MVHIYCCQGNVCVCPWFYNVLIMNNMWPEATVYTPDREALLVWFSLNRAGIIYKYLLLINPNYHLWEKMSPHCVHGKNLLDLVNTICGTPVQDLIYKQNALTDTDKASWLLNALWLFKCTCSCKIEDATPAIFFVVFSRKK